MKFFFKITGGKICAGVLVRTRVHRRVKKVLRQSVRRLNPQGKITRESFLKYKEAARALVAERIEYFSAMYRDKYGYDFRVGRVSIRNQSTRWGSCSSKGNLNFNYKIALLSPELADYIVVHELCHLGQFNHSQKFWDLVTLAIPDYATRMEELKKKGQAQSTKNKMLE